MAKVTSIEQTFYYAAPPEKVFSALTDPEQITGWFAQKAELSPKKGGSFRFTWGAYTLRGKVKAIVPQRKLALTWPDRFEGGRIFETEVKFDIRKKGKGTLLTVKHRGFKDGKKWIALYGAINSGWAYYLTNLRSVLEHGTDLRSDLDEL